MKVMKYTPSALEQAEGELCRAAEHCMMISQKCQWIAEGLNAFEDTFCAELDLLRRGCAPIREEARLLRQMGCILGDCAAEYEAAEQANEDAWWLTSVIDRVFIPEFYLFRTEPCGDITII